MNSISKCVVCTDPESEGNKVLSCCLCSVRVHQMCYGVKSYKERWKCAPCMSKTTGSRDPNCDLCLQYGGAFKKTSNGSWVHVVCGLFIQGVEFVNKDKMQPINISKIPDECRGKMCDFCLNDGVCCLCSAPDCNRWVHAYCAQKNASTKELTDKNSMITFLAYCENHTPSHRRISSVFVRDKLKEKSNDPEELTTIHDSSNDNNGQGIDDASNAIDFPNESVGSQASTSSSASVASYGNTSQNVTSQNVSGHSEESNHSNQSIVSKDSNVSDILDLSGLDNAGRNDDFPNEMADSQASTSSSASVASYGNISQNVSGHSEASNHSNQSIVSKDSNVSDIRDVSGLDNAVRNDDFEQINDDMDVPEYWWDHRELLIQLHSKDEKIMKLKATREELKVQLTDMQDENLNLQIQIQELSAKLQKKLKLTKDENVNACSSSTANPMDDILKTLEIRTSTQLSDDGSKLNFPNGVKLKVDLAKRLEIIPSEESSDRKFINETFDMFFSEKYIKKQIRNGCTKEQLLPQFRQTGRYDTMRDLYDLRVRRNARGNVEGRVHAFKVIFRNKLNNWLQKYEKSKNT